MQLKLTILKDFTVNEGLTVNKETGDFNGVKNEFTRIVLEKGTDNITVTDILPSKSLDLAPSGNSVMKNISSKQGIYEEKDGRCRHESPCRYNRQHLWTIWWD